MYHYLVAFCKVPVQNKKGGKVQKNSLCHRTEPPPPPTPQGGGCTQAAQKGVQQVLKKTISSPEMRLW